MARTKVQVCDVSKYFGALTRKSGDPVHALDHVSFSIAEGEFVALTGLSGCGKTTMLRIIMGLETASDGYVEVSGKRVTGCGYDRGLVFQHAELLPWRTALANAEFGLEVKGIPADERHEIAVKTLKLVGLEGSMDRRPHELSGGMKQRVGLARALAIDPEVLLMDEPFGSLDAQTREALQEELLNIHEQTGKTIVFVTHDLDEAVLLADRVVLMSPHPGRVREIVDVNIPRPRNDPIAIRGSEEFTSKRYHLWTRIREPEAATTTPSPATAEA